MITALAAHRCKKPWDYVVAIAYWSAGKAQASANKIVVLGVGSNPEPEHAVVDFDGKGTVAKSD